ncbi:hypothetical protein I9W82_001439 [Candida metapsilosis]|uniref:Uncharacterized protein n=1 Tax=Candida metapsilosis TaxID=273372 RepID=A0A8H8DDU0_9ASCO|nr:hypothetical protein I9W82_001439 [Candida metapsilosis]
MRKILSPARKLGFASKDLFLNLIAEYGVMQAHDKVKIVTDFWEKLIDPQVTLKVKFAIQNQLEQFMDNLDTTEQSAIKNLNLSKPKFVSKFLETHDPVLSTAQLKRFATVHPDLENTLTNEPTVNATWRAKSVTTQNVN